MNPDIVETKMIIPETKNVNGMVFKSINREVGRVYTYLRNGMLVNIGVDNPQWLHVRDSGSHMVIVEDGTVKYFPGDYVKIEWKNKDNSPEAIF